MPFRTPSTPQGILRSLRSSPEQNPFVARLKGFEQLKPTEEASLAGACLQTRSYPPGHDLIMDGEEPNPVFVILSGWAMRYKLLDDGTRQIIAFMMPGDFCDMHIAILDEMDHNIGTLTAATVATIQRSEIEALVTSTPALTRAFWWTQLVEASILRSTIVSMGRRSSVKRVAHLLCELCFRMRKVYEEAADSYTMPFSQIELADAVGLTPVHVNRTIRKLRLLGAVETNPKSIIVSDLRELARVAGFDASYLHQRLGHPQ